MNSKKIISIGALLAIVIGALVALGYFYTPATEETAPSQAEREGNTYDSNGVRFTYPEQYRLEERQETMQGASAWVVVLVDENAVVPDMSEGPTAISLIIVDNPGDLSVEEWVRTKPISNFALSQDEALAPLTVAGKPAVAYRHSGLYENDAVAIEHSGKIYLFSVGWMGEDDPIRNNFENLIRSLQFR